MCQTINHLVPLVYMYTHGHMEAGPDVARSRCKRKLVAGSATPGSTTAQLPCQAIRSRQIKPQLNYPAKITGRLPCHRTTSVCLPSKPSKPNHATLMSWDDSAVRSPLRLRVADRVAYAARQGSQRCAARQGTRMVRGLDEPVRVVRWWACTQVIGSWYTQ